MDPETAENIAFRAATKALELRGDSDVQKIFSIFGADISTAEGRQVVRENWAWLTNTRRGTQFIRKTTWGATLVSVVGGIIAAIIWALKAGLTAAVNMVR